MRISTAGRIQSVEEALAIVQKLGSRKGKEKKKKGKDKEKKHKSKKPKKEK